AALVKDASIELAAGGVQNTDGEQHSRLRKAVAKHYAANPTSQWARAIQSEAHKGIYGLRPEEGFYLRTDFFEPVAQRSAEKIFGFPASRRPSLDLFFNAAKTIELKNWLTSQVSKRTEFAEGTYLEALKGACRDGLISADELVINLTV